MEIGEEDPIAAATTGTTRKRGNADTDLALPSRKLLPTEEELRAYSIVRPPLRGSPKS